jgi:hypothetical protein
MWVFGMGEEVTRGQGGDLVTRVCQSQAQLAGSYSQGRIADGRLATAAAGSPKAWGTVKGRCVRERADLQLLKTGDKV